MATEIIYDQISMKDGARPKGRIRDLLNTNRTAHPTANHNKETWIYSKQMQFFHLITGDSLYLKVQGTRQNTSSYQ